MGRFHAAKRLRVSKTAKHKFVVWLVSQGKTVTAWAEDNHVPAPTVHNWIRGERKIPRGYATGIEAESGGAVPASYWPNIRD